MAIKSPEKHIFFSYFKDNLPFGYGRFLKIDGTMFEGNCENFKAQGKGSFVTKDGYKYIGEWVDDKKQGIQTI